MSSLELLRMNDNHPVGCPCFGCLHVGDQVLAYLSSDPLIEEIVVEVTSLSGFDSFGEDSSPIGVRWPKFNDGAGAEVWYISDNPDKPEARCGGGGKFLKKVK